MSIWKDFEIIPCSYIKEDKKLLDFQQYTVFNILKKKAFLVGLPTGGGKTFTSLASFFYYKEKYPKTKLIIVTNKSALFQFDSEIDKFFNTDILRKIVHADAETDYKAYRNKIYEDFKNNLDCFFTNYQTLAKDVAIVSNNIVEYKKKDKENKVFIIYDEATAFKNHKTRTYTAVANLTMRVDKAIALTATASKGKLEEIYNILNAIGLPIESNIHKFQAEYCIQKEVFAHRGARTRFRPKITVGYKNLDKFRDKIKDIAIILTKSDISTSLPPFTSKLTQLEMDDTQRGFIKEIQESELEGIVKIGHIRRTLLDPYIVNESFDKKDTYRSPKTLEILRLLEEDYDNEKVIIYSHSRKYINLLEEIISKECENKNYNKVLKITGEITSQQREEYKLKFSETSDHNILLINVAGIESLNLQISNQILVCDMPSSAGNLIQLLGRISRIGSEHSKLYVNYLMTNNTQDLQEYYIIMKQAFLLKNVIGEAEKNTIDYEILNKDNIFPGLTPEQLETMTLDKILMVGNTKSKKLK